MFADRLFGSSIPFAAVHWEVFIVPVIAMGVWLLGALFKGKEDGKSKKGGKRSGSPQGRRSVSDLDRFLEEARRRRESEERRKVPPPPPSPPVARTPPQRERLAPRREPAPRPVPTARPKPEILEALPVQQASIVLSDPAFTESVEFVAAPAAPARIDAQELRLSPAIQQVRTLLSKPQTAGTAFLLREIFDGPLCRRRRQR